MNHMSTAQSKMDEALLVRAELTCLFHSLKTMLDAWTLPLEPLPTALKKPTSAALRGLQQRINEGPVPPTGKSPTQAVEAPDAVRVRSNLPMLPKIDKGETT